MRSHTITSGRAGSAPVSSFGGGLKSITSFLPTGTSTDQIVSPVRVSISDTVLGCHDVLTYVKRSADAIGPPS